MAWANTAFFMQKNHNSPTHWQSFCNSSIVKHMLPALRWTKAFWLKTFIVFSLLLIVFSNSSLAIAATTQDPRAAVEGTATMGLAKVVETSLTNIKGGSIVSLSPIGKGAVLSTTP